MSFNIRHSFLCLALAAQLCDASFFGTGEYGVWCSGNQFPRNSSYDTNLRNLLSFLASNATKHERYYLANTTALNGSATETETIYGLFECRADSSLEDCTNCVNKSLSYLPSTQCPTDKLVMLWNYNGCSVRYSNVSFVGHLDERVHIGVRNRMNVTTFASKVKGQRFMALVNVTLHKLADMTSSMSSNNTAISRYFQTKTITAKESGVNLFYSMAQCTPTLSPSECKKCLGIAIDEMWACCNGSVGGQTVSPGCYTRFEMYPFYNTSLLSTPLHLTIGHSHSRRDKFLIASLVCVFPTSAVIWVLTLFSIRLYTRNKTMEKHDELDEIRSTRLNSLQFDYNTIKTATCNFSADNKVGKGGFGEVYKGKLKSGQEVAVKRLLKNTGQGIEQFKTEVVVVAKLQHKNLVRLLGYCLTSKEMMLVYEYLPNSSLDRFLFGQTKKAILDWETRFKIIVGVARGLLYLHEDSRLKVIHRDLKSSNILLDRYMNPKISDFGLAKHVGVDQSQGDTKRIAGTYGYMAPEYAISGRYSSKSDVYSFGVVILEILSGRRNSFFAASSLFEEELLPYASRLWNEGKALDLVDTALNNNFQRDEVLKCFHIGLLCIQENANERPTMNSIVAALNGQAINFPMPKPPLYLGNNANFDDANKASNQTAQTQSLSLCTGFQTITHLYPRD